MRKLACDMFFGVSKVLMMLQHDYLDRRRLPQLLDEIRDALDEYNVCDARG